MKRIELKLPDTEVHLSISNLTRQMKADHNGILYPVYELAVIATVKGREKPLKVAAVLPGMTVDKTDKRETRAIVAMNLVSRAITEILAEEEVGLKC